MDANYSFEFISIVHWVLKFITHNKSILGGVTPWKIGQCIMVRTDERWVLCYICMCKSIEGQSQIKIPSINLIRDQFSMNWASWNDYQASHIFLLSFFFARKKIVKSFFVQQRTVINVFYQTCCNFSLPLNKGVMVSVTFITKL